MRDADADSDADASSDAGADSGIGLILTDFFSRPTKRGGAWMSSFVEQSHLLGTKPVVVNVLNIAEPAEGEAALIRALDATRRRGATVIVAAHRTGVLAAADRLLVLSNGAVDCQGPADDVLAVLAKRAGETSGNVVGLKGATA